MILLQVCNICNLLQDSSSNSVHFDTHIYIYLFILFIYSSNVPRRARIRLARRHNDDEDSANKLFTLVSYVKVDTFKGKLCYSPRIAS